MRGFTVLLISCCLGSLSFAADQSVPQVRQYYLHGILSEGSAFPDRYLQWTGGQRSDVLDWKANDGYARRPFDRGSAEIFREEIRRLADRIVADHEHEARPVVLHGASAGGVAAAALVHELEARCDGAGHGSRSCVQVRGMVSYGTPQKRLRFHGTSIPTKIPVVEVRVPGDEILGIDEPFGAGTRPDNVRVIELSDDDPGPGLDHLFDQNYARTETVAAIEKLVDAPRPGDEAIRGWLAQAELGNPGPASPAERVDDAELDAAFGQVSSVLDAAARKQALLDDRAPIERPTDELDMQDALEAGAATVLGELAAREQRSAEAIDTIRNEATLRALIDALLEGTPLIAAEGQEDPAGPEEQHDHCAEGAFQCPNGLPWEECGHEEKWDCPPAGTTAPEREEADGRRSRLGSPYLPNGKPTSNIQPQSSRSTNTRRKENER